VVEFAFKEIKTATVSMLWVREWAMQKPWSQSIWIKKQFTANCWARLLRTRKQLRAWKVKQIS